uniref:Poly [ADP-ribose] polymerase n=1 Tax=Astyanax mexicanus TaxID=7994 RepID=A0A8B9KNH6_ASTMX
MKTCNNCLLFYFFTEPLEDNTVAVTRAGNLKCNFIIHMLGTNSTSKVQSRVKKVLEQCEQNKITTISFPAIGTGPPPTWTKMEGEDLQEVVLKKDSEEYKKIETEFLTSSNRIQNNGLWQRYCVLKKAMDKKYPNQKNEQFLYHGTTQEFSQKINKNGFNRSFCGRNAVVHGLGTYFAKEAWYSCQDQYSNPDLLGMKHIYRARVVTGSPCKSRGGMKEPDPLDPNNPQAGLHNCAVDNLQNPFIFVVFCDAGAYPDYLITFRNAEINLSFK